MPAGNADPSIDVDKYDYKANKVMLYVPVYNTATGLYGGLKKKLADITLRGDPKERFCFQFACIFKNVLSVLINKRTIAGFVQELQVVIFIISFQTHVLVR